jgi:type VI secretion system VasD/TssJ family lipoprotein
VYLHFQTARQLNQDAAGKSRSVGLWVYQFKTPEAIMAATFESIWVEGGAALVESLAARPDHVTFLPGEQAVRRLRRQPTAQYVALVGNFRGTDQGWKSIVRLPPPVDPCLQARGQAQPPPLRLHVYMQDFFIRVQTNFHIPKDPHARPPPPPPAHAPMPAVQPPPAQPVPQSPPPDESPGWIDPAPQSRLRGDGGRCSDIRFWHCGLASATADQKRISEHRPLLPPPSRGAA